MAHDEKCSGCSEGICENCHEHEPLPCDMPGLTPAELEVAEKNILYTAIVMGVVKNSSRAYESGSITKEQATEAIIKAFSMGYQLGVIKESELLSATQYRAATPKEKLN